MPFLVWFVATLSQWTRECPGCRAFAASSRSPDPPSIAEFDHAWWCECRS